MGTLNEFLSRDGIMLLGQVTKHEALGRLCEAVCRRTPLDVGRVHKAVLEREAMLSTGIGLGIALPHVRLPEADRFLVSVGVSAAGIEYGSLDNKPVHILILIVGPSRSHNEFVGFVALVTGVLKREQFRQALLAAANVEEVREVLKRF